MPNRCPERGEIGGLRSDLKNTFVYFFVRIRKRLLVLYVAKIVVFTIAKIKL